MGDSSSPDLSRSSFYWAMRFLPRPKREAMFAVYRFCRAVDDIADGEEPAGQKLRHLSEWRADLERLFTGEGAHVPEIAALERPLHAFGFDGDALRAIVSGMEMDVRGEMRAPSLEALELYCRRVAGAVGLLAIRIFGSSGPSSLSFALALGDALQMTNILRDLEEDAARGRLYLPRDFLDQADIRVMEPMAVLRDPGLPHACELLAGLATERYRQALASLPPDPRPLRPAMIMMAVYARLLRRMRRNGWTPPQPARVPGAERLWVALRHLGPPATWPGSI